MSGTVVKTALSQRHLKGPIFSLTATADVVAAGHHNGLIDVCKTDSETPASVTEIAAHTGTVRQLLAVEELQSFFSCSSDGHVKRWRLSDCQWMMTYTGHNAPVECMTVDASRGVIFSGSVDGVLKQWNIESGECQKTLRCHIGKISALVIPKAAPPKEGETVVDPPRANTILTASDDSLAKLIDPASKLVHVILKGEKPIISMVYLHPNVFLGCTDGSIRGYSLTTAQGTALFRGHTDAVNGLLLYEQRLFSVSDDMRVCLWNLRTWEISHEFSGHARCVSCLAMAPGGRLYTADFEGVVRCWDAEKIHQQLLAAEDAAVVAAASKKKAEAPPPKKATKK